MYQKEKKERKRKVGSNKEPRASETTPVRLNSNRRQGSPE